MLKNSFQSIVSKSSTDRGRTKLFEMDIPTKGPPIRCRPYSIPLKYHKFVDKEIKLTEATDCISKHFSPWAAPVIIILKKSDPTQPDELLFQMVVDYRQLNNTISSAHNSDNIDSYYPPPNISDLLARLGNYKIFSLLDLHSGYYHISLKSEAYSKTVFATMSGKWQWNVTPFGIWSLPGIFSYLMF